MQRAFESVLGRELGKTQNASEAIVKGCALQSAMLSTGARVREYHVADDGVTIVGERDGKRFRFRARALVGADGSSSVVARQLRGAAPSRNDRIVAVRAYVEGIDGPSDQADFYFTSESFPGYYWLFPTGSGQANLGVGMLLGTMPPTEDRLRELLLSLVARDEGLAKRVQLLEWQLLFDWCWRKQEERA